VVSSPACKSNYGSNGTFSNSTREGYFLVRNESGNDWNKRFVKVIDDKILIYKEKTDKKAVNCYNIAECNILNKSQPSSKRSSGEECELLETPTLEY
jgi:hypothetical protein